MPENLFPTKSRTAEMVETTRDEKRCVSTVRFDFEKHEFVTSPTGKMPVVQGANAWAEWCVKALCTERYAYLIYDHSYGSELDKMIGKSYPHDVAEVEIQRIVTECLMTHPLTKSVSDFLFDWINDGVMFTCNVRNTLGDGMIIARKVVK